MKMQNRQRTGGRKAVAAKVTVAAAGLDAQVVARPVTAADAPHVRVRPYRPTFAPPITDQRDVIMTNQLLAGATKRQAYDAAGYRDKPVTNVDAVVRKKRKITEQMRATMRRNQITGDFLVSQCLKPALMATETRFFKSWDGKRNIIDKRTVKNWDARLRALDMSFNLLGAYPARPSRLELDGEGTININVQRVS